MLVPAKAARDGSVKDTTQRRGSNGRGAIGRTWPLVARWCDVIEERRRRAVATSLVGRIGAARHMGEEGATATSRSRARYREKEGAMAASVAESTGQRDA
ncbi:uncharacterized protein DS421_6g195300 [Arachis hypogaea]|nr:uncharacterized protein DS421_6g195300 [Arachis hypogaea]